MKTFPALTVEETTDGNFTRRIVSRNLDDLPDGELLVRVHYSSLNFKDALSATGNKGITRHYPHTPGIDAAGIVEVDTSARFSAGDKVIVTSYDLGMNTPGGFGCYIRVPASWAVPLPQGLSLRESMVLGTAGFTAALSVHKMIEAGIGSDRGDILVTGATGGVGSLAIALLAKIGYRVVAATGKMSEASFLKSLGAAEVTPRTDIIDPSGKALLPERWAGALDVAGGNTLVSVLKALRYGGAATCCGLVDSPQLPGTVFPFILRGVSLLGINSENTPMPLRETIWRKLAGEWKVSHLEELVDECPLEELEVRIQAMLAGKHKGRTVVNLW